MSEIRRSVSSGLSANLALTHVNSPLYLPVGTGLQDNLSGSESPVCFTANKQTYEIVHSLAKWKRDHIRRTGITGIICNMIAIRKDETPDWCHSMLVEQFDWEKTAPVFYGPEERDAYVITIADTVYHTIRDADIKFNGTTDLPEKLTVVDSRTTELTERELVNMHGAIFLMRLGKEHGRSPDYDNWEHNGDIIVRYRGEPLELSSMGYRVDAESLMKQLEETGNTDRVMLDYHKRVLEGTMPQTIGGGIGQARVEMLIKRARSLKDLEEHY